MAELDSISLFNPSKKDFTQNFNGEPYTIKANEQKAFVKSVGFHLAKHLAHKIIDDEVPEEDKKDPKRATQIAQRFVFDNEKLRIALYKILRDVDLVKQVVMAYPYKGWIGDMSIYETFVAKEEAKRNESSAEEKVKPAVEKETASSKIK